jgi:hypothetical protein
MRVKQPLARFISAVSLLVGLSLLIGVSAADAQVSACSMLSPGSTLGLYKAYCALGCSAPGPKIQEACDAVFATILAATGLIPLCETCPLSDPDVICLALFDPVTCGGCVYTNQCFAGAAGFTLGECQSVSEVPNLEPGFSLPGW